MKILKLPLIAVFCLFSGCASHTNDRQASIKIIAPPVGMYLLVGIGPGEDFEMHPGDKDWEITRDPVTVIIAPVLAEGKIILGNSDIKQTPGEYVKNQGSCSMKEGYTATIEIVGYREVVCSGNEKIIIQKGDTAASSVIIAFSIK
ncbi:hypothetical protein [Pseudomonas fluorescens]|uniref:Lipoprotein n=1 Tax=Pseudomonas fluorescens TaxID=294 RepID=A0A5E7CX33_PSEFL|nr:hypothetical protein [Pseudomonas fluorescens]VVO09820.1 hypothetical protein PS691_03307 [Pseudomonas fluorescens]